jgi:hypothetical protein
LLGKEAAAFFLVEEEGGVGGEVVALGGRYGCDCVFLAEGRGSGTGLFSFEDFSVEAAVEEDKEAEVIAKKNFSLAGPGVLMFAWRIIEPVACEGKVLMQDGEGGVARVVVAVEAQVLLLCTDGVREKDSNESDYWKTHRQ